MVDFANVTCPSCRRAFMVHHEFFRIDGAYCHCPYCATEFPPPAEGSTTIAGLRRSASPAGAATSR